MITKEQLIENVFKKYEDPEIHLDVWTIGLVYDIKIDGTKVDGFRIKGHDKKGRSRRSRNRYYI